MHRRQNVRRSRSSGSRGLVETPDTRSVPAAGVYEQRVPLVHHVLTPGGRLMLERFFRLRENGTTVRTEVLAGITTFLTMAYIIVVQPAMLSSPPAGMDFQAVT